MESVDNKKLESTEKSIQTIHNINIEHAYSEEFANNMKNDELFLTNNKSADSINEKSKQDLTMEQVAEKVKSRELKSLLDAAKESNLNTNIVHKRESRKSIDPYGTKASNETQELSGKRLMRSQNSDLTIKEQKALLKQNKSETISEIVDNENTNQDLKKDLVVKTLKRKRENFTENNAEIINTEDRKKNRKTLKTEILNINIKNDKDSFCWRCHRDGVMVQCETCPRAFHLRCLKQPVNNPDRWPCPECLAILQAESTKTRSPAMQEMTLEHLCELLKYAVKRMIGCPGSEPFIHPVDLKNFPDYRNYVIQPMDLTTLENNIRNNLYGSTVAFLADAKWILHNSIIYNSYQSKLTTAAKSITKICKQEMSEIETCSECYQKANTKKNSWFVEVCPKPHILLWAKLKGFPYWPAKAMTTNAAGLVDVRFFGAHDRAWIPVKECFLFSKKDPNTTNKNKRNNIAECIKEVDIHIEKLKETFGGFCYAPYRTLYDPSMEMEQLSFMLPKYKPNFKLKCYSKSAKTQKLETEEDEQTVSKKIKTTHTNISEKEPVLNQTVLESTVNTDEELKERSDISDESELLSSSSKTSFLSEDKDKFRKITTNEFDKFMDGYGTEDDETTALTLNDEVRKNITPYDSESEEDDSYKNNISSNNGTNCIDTKTDDAESINENLSDSSLNKIKLSEIENIDKIKSIDQNLTQFKYKNISITRSNEFESIKLNRRNSDISLRSDSSRLSTISDKISRVEEFSDSLEVTLPNIQDDSETVSSSNISPEINDSIIDKETISDKSKQITSDLVGVNNEFKISSPTKAISITDHLMKKISGSEIHNELEKVEAVKKKILENLETSTSNSLTRIIQNNSTSPSDAVSNENLTETDAAELSINNTFNQDMIIDTTCENNEIPEKKTENISDSQNASTIETPLDVLSFANKDSEKQVENSSDECFDVENQNKSFENNLHVSSDGSEICDEVDNEIQSSESSQKNVENSQIKLVNVSDIISGKINGNSNKVNYDKHKLPKLLEIKTESLSEEEELQNESEKETLEKDTLIDDQQLNSSDEQNTENNQINKETCSFKVVDNLTRIIDSVASDYNKPLAIHKKEITLKPVTKLIQSPKQKARKSFINSPHKINQMHSMFKNVAIEKNDNLLNCKPSNELIKDKSTIQTDQIQNVNVCTSSICSNPENMIYISPQITPVLNNVTVLPPNQPITLTQNVNSPILAMVQHSISTPNVLIQQAPTISLSTNTQGSTTVSQCSVIESTGTTTTIPTLQAATTPITNLLTISQVSEQSPLVNDRNGLSETISKAVGELFCRPPPTLKPKPPGPLSTHFDEGTPSNAGPSTRLINSVSHRLSDYFRGLLKETLQDLINIGSPEAKIRSLELEIETMKYKHSEEMLELRKNIGTILKDVQKSIIEDKARIVDETRAVCEAERIRCIEETKSKQWCAYCLKEAQFFCCWNTSYCDYPCQQKHWPTHMNTCSQTRNVSAKGNITPDNKFATNSASKSTKTLNSNKTLLKSTRMIVKQANKGVPMYVPVQRAVQGGQQTLTLVESTPGNFEIVGNHGPISLGGKIVPSTTIKVKSGNVFTMPSASNSTTTVTGTGTQKTIILSQKIPQIIQRPSTENKTK